MNEITIFSNDEFGQIRTLVINEQPWFVGKDVAEVLGYESPRSAVSKKVDDEDRGVAKMETPSGIQEMTIINESGLFALILSSKLPSAKRFKHWVTSVVLPQIRKTGGYIPSPLTPDGGMPSDEDIMARALMIAQKTIDLKNKQLEEQRDKVEFAEAVVASKGSIYVAQLANLLYQNGYETGQNRLFQTLRDRGYLYKTKNGTRPMQCYVESGLFEVNVSVWESDDGDKHESFTTMVTPKGQKYFVDLFC